MTDSSSHVSIGFTAFMIIWPWIFFGVLWSLGGIQLRGHAGRAIERNPKGTTYVVTILGTIITSIVDVLFSTAITSLAQKWVTHRETDVFMISCFTSLKHRSLLFPKESWLDLSRQYRLRFILMMPVLVVISNLINGGLTTFLTPTQFTRTALLHGKELDFASSDASCLAWFNDTTIPTTCDWVVSFDAALKLKVDY